MMVIYDGNTLLTPSYCYRKYRELDTRFGGADYLPNPKIRREIEKRDYYGRIYTKLQKDFEGVKDDELVSFVVEQLAYCIKRKGFNREVSITCWHVDAYTVKISIGQSFDTELTFSKKLYEESYCLNDDYDGYFEIHKYVLDVTATLFLKEIMSTITKELKSKLPKVSVSIINYN